MRTAVCLLICFSSLADAGRGADPRPAIVKAVEDLLPDAVAVELEKGADPNLEFGGDPLVQKVLGFLPGDPFREKLSPEERTQRIGKILEALFEGGANPNRRGRYGQTFLTTLVLEHGDAYCVELAIRHGALVNGPNGEGDSPIHLAATWPKMLKTLLENGADAGLAHPKTGATPLMLAVAEPSVEAVEILLKEEASPAAVDLRGRNAFHHLALRAPQAAEEAKPLSEIAVTCAGRFHAAGADFRLADKEGATAFHLAAENPASGLLNWCLGQERVPLEEPDRKGRTPLVRALEAIEVENIRLLLDAGARVPATGLLAPVARAHHESRISPETYVTILKSMGDLQDAPDLPDAKGWTALMWAAASDVTGAVEFLLEQGADPERPAPDGRRALHFAAASGSAETVALLLERGAEAGAVDAKGATAAEWAVRWGHHRVAEALLAAMPRTQETFRLALEAGSIETVSRLLDEKVAWVQAEIDGSPPLHRAIRRKDAGLVGLLIARGADVNALDRSGLTPLSCAVLTDSSGIVKQLLAGGADPASFAKDGSALALAAETGRSVLLETLLQGLPAVLDSAGSSRLLAVAIGKDDLALFRFLLHHERLQFAARDREIDPKTPDGLLAAATNSSDRYLREWIGKTKWNPSPEDPVLNQLWLSAVSGGSVAVAGYLHETYSVDLDKTSAERGLKTPSEFASSGLVSDPFADPAPSKVTPLLIAFKAWNADMIGYLRSRGAKPAGAEANLPRLAEDFARMGKVELLAHALDFLESPEIGDPNLLMQAASGGFSDCVALLLKRGADPAARDGEGKSVLDHALAGGEPETIRLVREALP